MPTPRPTSLGAIVHPALFACVLALVCAFALAIPGSGSPSGAAATVGWILLTSLPLALAWMVSAWGLGIWTARWLSPSGPRALAMAFGAATLLWIDHLLGICGVLSPIASWAMLIPGFVGAIVAFAKSAPSQSEPRCRPSWWILLCAPGAGLMLAAACLPPGSIWESEARGYDVLEYHLQLPKEWLAAGRVWPTGHNVYSFLPSYMESTFARLGALSGIDPGSTPLGASSGVAIHAAQMLHVLFALLTAWCVGTLVRVICSDSSCHGQLAARVLASDTPSQAGRGTQSLDRSFACVSAGAAMLSIPWMVVTGSMAYNEMALCAMLGAALLAAWPRDVPPLRKGIAVGLLIGAACSLKPTAIFMAMPPAAMVLAVRTRPRGWFGAFGGAAVFGGAVIAPWLIRNWLVSGNPVFPSMASVFGPGPWSDVQHVRWDAAHHVDLSITERLARLVSSGFGFTHAQWSIWVFLVVGGAIVCLLAPRAHKVAVLLILAIVAQIMAWLFIGHLQSRFLTPVGVTGTIVIGIALGTIIRARPRLGTAIAVVIPLFLAADSIRLFFRESGSEPNRALVGGVEVFNATRIMPREFGPGDREGIAFYKGAGPVALINHIVLAEPNTRVLLLGDATPLYFNDAGERIVYASPWDTHPVARALDAHSDDLDAALASLRDEQGFTHILLNLAELDRLRASGYTDPRLTDELGRDIARRMSLVMTWPQRGQLLVEFERTPVDSTAQ